jgi:hypothetical protein
MKCSGDSGMFHAMMKETVLDRKRAVNRTNGARRMEKIEDVYD